MYTYGVLLTVITRDISYLFVLNQGCKLVQDPLEVKWRDLLAKILKAASALYNNSKEQGLATVCIRLSESEQPSYGLIVPRA